MSSDQLSSDQLKCDLAIINYVQDAILSIKELKQPCNITRIFCFIKQKHSEDKKVTALTEPELVRQLELAVTDGLLSRKLRNNLPCDTSNGMDRTNSEINKKGRASKMNITSSHVFKLPTEGYTLKNDTVKVRTHLKEQVLVQLC